MTDFQLGQRVAYTHPLKRVSTWDDKTRRGGRAWEHSAWAKDAEQQREGIIIGKRTLVNGDCEPWEEEVGIIFLPREHFQAYLIATDLRRKPVYVRVEHVRSAPLRWESIPDEAPLLTAREARDLASTAWLEGAAAGAAVDAGFIPSDVLARPLPPHLAEDFRLLNPHSTQEA